ncbi:MAG: aminopeptidase P family protein [Candidatus Thorarchaeota archaeon]|nr:aminopeptidase P family protein [Candidatus Thorarchaeota archaeon]
MTRTRITPDEHQERITSLQSKLEEKDLRTFVVLNAKNIFYLSSFSFIPTERPIALIIHDGEVYAFLPSLEIDHIEDQVPFLNEVYSYYEYPDLTHPMEVFSEVLIDELKVQPKTVASESPGFSGYWGYEGPSFEEATGLKFEILSDIVMDMRVVKEPAEIELMRESAKWASRAHHYLQEYTEVGKNEIDVTIRASSDASDDMVNALGDDYHPTGFSMFPATALYRGQIGANSYFPHALSRGLTFSDGDTLVTGATSDVYGIQSELERTMFMGEPNSNQRKLFDAATAAQSAALSAAGPGVKCADVDKAARKALKEHGVFELARHHTGHGLGLEGHERPFLDIGSKEEMEPGMIFSCEPGVYAKGVGGFRHSDTFVVTEAGIDILTEYPLDVEELIVE